jgi:hypothetical protein
MELIIKSIKRLSDNIPNGIKKNAKCLNVKMEFILKKMSENEDIRKLKDISNKI